MKLKTRESVGVEDINGTDLDVFISQDGNFTLYLDGAAVASGKTLNEAKTRARRELAKKRVKVNVPFLNSKGELRTATGIHRGMNKVVVTGGREIEYMNTYIKVWKHDTPREVLDRHKEIQRTQNTLSAEVKTMEEEHKINLNDAVRDAIHIAAEKELSS